MTNKILTIILIFLIGLFCFSLFKNIQYPLLWADEADTAMFAARILKYGIPKVNDGKNIINSFHPPYFSLAVNQKLDAFVQQGWSEYYFAAIGVSLASQVKDIYLKTAFLRIPFATIGMIGILIFALSVINILKSKQEKLLFGILFLILEISSVSLLLHLREVRYYSLVIFLSACIFYIYFKYKFFESLRFSTYSIILILLLLFIFNTFYPIYSIFLMTFFIYEFILFIALNKQLRNKNKLKTLLLPFLPLILSVILTIPFLVFFNVLSITSSTSKMFHFALPIYIRNLSQVFRFLNHFELLGLLLLVKSAVLILVPRKELAKRNLRIGLKLQISLFLSLFLLIHILLIAYNPIYVFTRYFIVLQPVISVILIIDIFILYEYLSNHHASISHGNFKKLFILSFFILFIIFGRNKIEPIKGHVYELFHQYKGPLDYIIPFIKDNFKNPEKLVIATNYDEISYIYYLDSKVIIGYVGNNLENDIKMKPDIIIYRNGWEKYGWLRYSAIFNYLWNQDKYQEIKFPVYNYPLNNIPDLDFLYPHLFQTKLASEENEKASIFVKEDINSRNF